MQLCLLRIGILLSAGVTCAISADPQVCTNSAEFYEAHTYTVRKIDIDSPLDFVSVVRARLNAIRKSLTLQEGKPFSKQAYEASFKEVDQAVNNDGAFGTSRAKVVVVTDKVQNCQDSEKALDVAYHVFSSDPMLASATPENRQALVNQPATSAAQDNTNSFYKFAPLTGYDHSRRGYGGGDVKITVPGGIFRDFDVSGSGSSSSRLLDAQMNGEKKPHKLLLDQVDYHLAYNYSDVPTSGLQLAKGFMNLRFTGFSKPGKLAFRYGASVEGGNQQSGHSPAAVPSDVLANSQYEALRFYTGLTYLTRYSSATVSYGIQRGGAGFGDLSFTKQVGDITYTRRLPGGSHRPMDVQARASAGGILSSEPILVNDRFFGGNSISRFIPGDSWVIPDGPVVRSIASNRLSGDGFGGTSFYSANVTVGKVIYGYPLIPDAINSDPGFGQGLNAAEQTAENFFADDYETSSPEYKKAVSDGAAKLSADLKALQQTSSELRSQGNPPAVLNEIDSFARRSLNIIGHATTPDAHGQVHSLEIIALLNPTTSLVRKLIAVLPGSKRWPPRPSPPG